LKCDPVIANGEAVREFSSLSLGRPWQEQETSYFQACMATVRKGFSVAQAKSSATEGASNKPIGIHANTGQKK
jgi:hypothetical protein